MDLAGVDGGVERDETAQVDMRTVSAIVCPTVNWLWWVILGALGAAAVAGAAGAWRRLSQGPGESPGYALLWHLAQPYLRFVHRPTYEGLEHVPKGEYPGPLIVVANHTAGLDPVLIGTACRFQIRWMMAREYMTPEAMWFWRLMRIIPVERTGRDAGPAREAIRHVREGGVIGVFPEGGIERPRGEIRPFIPGIGLIVARTRAPVLLVHVSGTPETDSAFGSLVRRSRSRVRFIDLIQFDRGARAAEIVDALRSRLAEASGWPLNDEPLPTARRNNTPRDPFAP